MSPAHLATRALVLVLLAGAVTGAVLTRRVPGDKTEGEEEEIHRREQWFAERRGLGKLRHPGTLRAAAVAFTRDQSRSGKAFGVPSWQPLGPRPLAMLDWQMGPVSGRVEALAVDPRDEAVLYLGAAAGGVWKSTDGGAHWRPIFDQVGTEAIGALYLEPSAPDTVWAGTGEHAENCYGYFGMGLFRSTDGGDTWAARNGSGPTRLALSYISRIDSYNDAQAQRVLLVAGRGECDGGSFTPGGVFRSTDDGASWQQTLGGYATDLAFHPATPATQLAALGALTASQNGIYRSTDGGQAWARLETGGLPFGDTVRRTRLAIAPSDPQSVYAYMVRDDGHAQLWRSTDGGSSWTQTHADACDGQCFYNLALAVDPTNATTLLVGAIRFARSIDGGTTLDPLTASWGSGQEVHQDTHVLVYSQLDANRFWIGSDGGLWRSDDGGASYVNLNADLAITQDYDIALRPDDPGTVFGGSQDNSCSRRSTDDAWEVTEVTGDGFVSLVDPAAPRTVFQSSSSGGGVPSVMRSFAGGKPGTFEWLPSTGFGAGEPMAWVTPMAIFNLGGGAPSYVFLGSNRVYRAPAATLTADFAWTPISPTFASPSGGALIALAPVAVGGSIRLYTATGVGKIFVGSGAEGGTVAWTDVTGNFPNAQLTDLAADPTEPDRVYATVGEFGATNLYRSTSGGTTWVAGGTGLPMAPANTVAVDPREPSRIFVGTDVGVYASTDYGDTFSPLNDGLPLGVPIVDLEVDDDPWVLAAATYGRGAWRLDFETVPLLRDDLESGALDRWLP